MKILRENPRDLDSAIQVAMHKQNLTQRLAIKGSSVTHNVQIDDNRQTSSGLETTMPLLKDRLVIFSRIETRHEEPIEIDHAKNNRSLKCKKTGHMTRFCPQNKRPARPRPQLSKRPNQIQTVHNAEQSRMLELW